MRDPLTCDVHDCDQAAFVRVYPTNGRTDHAGLRCRDCLESDLERNWFKQWRRAIEEQRESQAGGEP